MVLFRTEEAAERLTVSKATLEAWRCRGGGPVFLKLGKAVRYRLSDLDAFTESRLMNNTSKKASDRAESRSSLVVK